MNTNLRIDLKLTSKEMGQFYDDNHDFNILSFNFLAPQDVSKLKIATAGRPALIKKLMSYQRLLRIYPNVSAAKQLISDNLDSSIKITNVSWTTFIKKYGPQFDSDGPETAQKIYSSALNIKDRTMNLVATAHSLVASPHFRASRVHNVSEGTLKEFEDLPSYQEFFGSLDYCDCEECKSIFGPAAYLVDLLRIIDKSITKSNPDISEGLKLFERRPDLENIELTCNNTNSTVPYLQIVNKVLKSTVAHLSGSLGEDPFQTLANSLYPFNLPFNLPLQQIITVLSANTTSLYEISLALSTASSFTDNEARKNLNISIETLNNVLAPASVTPDQLNINYGTTGITTSSFDGLDKLDTFLQQTGLSLSDFELLLTQNLNAAELKTNTIPHSFSINSGLSASNYLQVDGDVISNQDLGTLDRLNRFIRLSNALGWSFIDLNWMLKTLDTTNNDITKDAITEISKIKYCTDQYDPDLSFLACLWFDIKTIGVGIGVESQAPFDQIFNSKTIVQQTGKTYHPTITSSPTSFVNPLYLDTALPWIVNQQEYDKLKNSDKKSAEDLNQGLIIVSGIPGAQTDITAIAQAAFGPVATIDLTVSNLSVLYRHVMLAKGLNITVASYVLLLKLLSLGNAISINGKDTFEINQILDRSQLLTLLKTIKEIQAASLTVFDIDYVCNQTNDAPVSPFVNPGYEKANLPEFLKTVKTNLATALCKNDSFKYNSLTGDDSTQIYNGLVAQEFIDSSGLIIKDLATSTVDWSSILIGKPGVKPGTTQKKFVLSKMQTMQKHQDELFAGQIGPFFSVKEDIAAQAVDAVKGGDAKFLQTFIATPDPTITAKAETFILSISKYLLLQRVFAFNESEFSNVCLCPEAYGITAQNDFTITAVLTIAKLKPTITSFSDSNDKLMSYFSKIGSLTSPTSAEVAELQTELCRITQWNKNQYIDLAKTLLTNNTSKICETLTDVLTIKKVFDIANKLGVDTYFLSTLNQTTSLASTTTNWPVYMDVAAHLLLSLQGTMSADASKSQFKQINSIIEGKKRDALLGYCIWKLGSEYGITNAREVYEFLMIDPQMSGCAEISYVKEALNAAQLYLQRCRLGLEENVIVNPDDLPDVWWEWLLDYRVWEANRQIFLYPENYIDPTLRKSSTTLFKNLENTLQQGEINKENVEVAYVKYLDDFSKLAKLRYVDAYQTIVESKEKGPTDTLYLFARTQEEPYHFYYIAGEKMGQTDCPGSGEYVWSQWKNIDIKIDSEYITPVYAFNKLFVFWVELTQSKESAGFAGKTGTGTDIHSKANIITTASIKYSYYNFNGKWVQPQTLVADKVINVITNDKADQAYIYGSFADLFSNPHALYWKKVNVVKTKPENYVTNGDTAKEKLTVFFGPLVDSLKIIEPPAPVDPDNYGSTILGFFETLSIAYTTCIQSVVKQNNAGVPLIECITLDEQLNASSNSNEKISNLVFKRDELSATMGPTFNTELQNNSIFIWSDDTTLETNYYEGMPSTETLPLVKGPQTLSSDSFIQLPYIDSATSSTIFAALQGLSDWFDTDTSQLKEAALNSSVPIISAKLSVSSGQAKLIQNKFFKLYYGPRILFSNADSSADIIPVKNQPNSFLLINNGEMFLVRGDTTVGLVNAVTNDSFVSNTPAISKQLSETFYGVLSNNINKIINSDGTVNQQTLAGLNAYTISQALGTTTEVAQAVLNTLQTSTTPKVITRDFNKIDEATKVLEGNRYLTKDSFISNTPAISKQLSETFYGVLSNNINKIINSDGTVNQQTLAGLNAYTISQALGATTEVAQAVLNILKNTISMLTKESFISKTALIDKKFSESIYNILSNETNKLINSNGSVNQDILTGLGVPELKLILNDTTLVAQSVLNVLYTNYIPTLAWYCSSNGDSNNLIYDNPYSLQFKVERISTGAIRPLSQALFAGGINDMLAPGMQQLPVNISSYFDQIKPNENRIVPSLTEPVIVGPKAISNNQIEFNGPYGNYYWELFFHTPFLVSSLLNTNQKFSDSETWLQYIFNPTEQIEYLTEAVFISQGPVDVSDENLHSYYPVLVSSGDIDASGNVTSKFADATPELTATLLGLPGIQSQEIYDLINRYYLTKPQMRFWQFEPFRNYTLKTLLSNLSSCAQIAVYNDDPFDPQAIARLRIGAFEKTIMMKYIDNLLDWGDYEFSQYSWESITSAKMLYSYAYDLLGPKPVSLGQCETELPVTFQQIAAKYASGEIPQFLIDMEHLTGGAQGCGSGITSKAYNDLGDYFCIPENDQLTAYWTRVEDRLYKIRHCLNIDGEPQPLPLFQPPINPMDLIRAAAEGGNVLSVANQQQQNISYYRFSRLIGQAQSVAAMVGEFGSALLSALEKSDAESLALLNNSQAKTVLTMSTTIKQNQIDEMNSRLTGLQVSLDSAQNRNTWYTNLINSGYNSSENTGLSLMQAGIDVQEVVAGIQGISIVGYLAPCIFGFSDGGMKFGDAINMGSQILQTTSQILSQKGGVSQTVAQYQRRKEDWQLQQKSAQFDVSQIQDQITSLKVSISSANQELEIHTAQIQQNEDQATFYKTKFTDQQLYQWMISRVSSVYFQAYTLALDIALKAQTVYQYELDREDAFINFGYWDSLHKGLLAADGLKLSLAQLENAYLDNNERRLEIEKTVSLKEICPEEFFAFKTGIGDNQKGKLSFSLTQELFDRDFPSHYCRKIKSVSVTIPAVLGPYRNLNASLTQNSNLVVLQSDTDAVKYAIYQTAAKHSGTAPSDPGAQSLRQNWASEQQVAITKAVNDSGLFQLNFEDQRYLPFEETGAVSKWTLSLPPKTNPLNFTSISDIILTVCYTALDGGSTFGKGVSGLYSGTDTQYQNLRMKSFNMKQAFSENWQKLFSTAPVSGLQTLTFPVTDNIVLPNLTDVTLNSIIVQLEGANNISIGGASAFSLKIGETSVPSTPTSISNNVVVITQEMLSQANIATWEDVNWGLVFDPSQLTTVSTSDSLDPAKLLNINVIITYESAM